VQMQNNENKITTFDVSPQPLPLPPKNEVRVIERRNNTEPENKNRKSILDDPRYKRKSSQNRELTTYANTSSDPSTKQPKPDPPPHGVQQVSQSLFDQNTYNFDDFRHLYPTPAEKKSIPDVLTISDTSRNTISNSRNENESTSGK